jgi:N12 class adenine-specific DNA methylase
MESLTGRSSDELQKELGSLVYRNPESETWETADRYLSGNVRITLTVAQHAERTIQPIAEMWKL